LWKERKANVLLKFPVIYKLMRLDADRKKNLYKINQCNYLSSSQEKKLLRQLDRLHNRRNNLYKNPRASMLRCSNNLLVQK
jgi:hypothetical protein